MTANVDWLAYVFEPHNLLPDLEHLADDFKVKLMRSFLSQAECHDRRLSSVPVNEEDKLNSENLSPSLSSNAVSINYDKSKTLDCLAMVIAAHFRFNVNLFAGVVTELPLRLASRLYRMLFHTLLERNSRGSTESGGTCTTPYDLGPWDTLEPTLAFATLVYHLWCLQVALSDSMLSLPNRDMTPAVWGLSEVPDQAFLQDSRADREALLMRHEESALRVHDLLRRLQVSESAVSVARPTPASLAIATTVAEEEVPLPANRLVAGAAFTLGRLAFQHNLLEKATELFLLAQKAITAAQLECIEESGMTPLLVRSYLTCCQQQQPSRSLTTPSPIAGHWHLVDAFCTTLRQSLDTNDPDFFTLLSFSIPSPVRANLRGSSSSSSLREAKKATAKGKFSQEDLIAALEADTLMPKSVAPQLGFGLRRYLQQLTHEALVTLTARCANSPRKEVTHLRRALHDWQSFYTKVVVNNGIKGILQSSSVQNTAFCETLLLGTGEDDAPSIDAKEAAGILFASLDRVLCEDAAAKTEVVNFVGDFLVRIRLMLSGGRSTASSRAAMLFVDALTGSTLMNILPTDFQNVAEVLQKDRKVEKQMPDYLFNDLPDVATGCMLPPPLVVSQVHRGHLYSETRTTSPFSLLIASSNPKVVLNACTDLLNAGSSVEVILRSGGWMDTILPTIIKWITPSDPPSNQRRDTSLNGGLPPPLLYEFLAVASENGQCCLPPLLLLLRAIDFRRERGDYEAATTFRLAANHVFPPPGQGTPSGPTGGGGGGSGALWRRSLPRWIRGVMEHEAVVVDLLRSMNCNSFSPTPSQVRIEEAELVNRCKAILANDLGPDAVLSDDLVSCATCYLLIKKPSFFSTLSGGPPMLEFIVRLHKLSMEKEKAPLAVRDLCINRLLIWLRPILEVPSPLPPPPPPPPPPSRMSRDPRHLAGVTGGGGSGGPAVVSNAPIPPPNTDPLRFLIRLLTQMQGDDVHRRLLDSFINCLASCAMSVQPLFKTDMITEPWLSLPPLSGVAPQALTEILQLALTCGINLEPRNVKWLLLQADLQMASTNADSRTVLSLILQAAAVASDYFARPVPSSVFTERTLATMVQCCRSLGCTGEAIVLCQFGPDRGALITTGLQIIDSLRCEGNVVLPYTFDSLDGIATFLWNLDLLEALANLQFFNGSQSKKTTFLRCINQPEVNAFNTREILQMTRNKRASEFLRHLSNQILT